jgi:arylsulfatase A-like enzyme
MIGNIVQALDASPARDNTTIVLWGDNGFHLGEKLHWRKFVLWEEATRVPLVIVPPKGVKAAPYVHDPVSLIDIFPTLFELSSLPRMDGIDGASLCPQMFGGAARTSPAVTTWLDGNHSIRQGTWRYTRYRDGSEELYDHMRDPYEWNNLAKASQFKEMAQQFRSQIDIM